MRTYRQYCPVARASEILAERWNPLIIRNLMFGASTFSAIAGGVPTMSRSMLIKRLRQLEEAGVIVSEPKPNGHGATYSLSDAGADLARVIDEMGQWAERWVEVLPAHNDPGFALWAWCSVQLNRATLPEERVVVEFDFSDQPAGNRYFWLLMQDRTAELCTTDPGGEPGLRVVARASVFVDWHRGALSWADATRTGGIALSGNRRLARAFPTWNTHTPVLA